MKKASTLMNAVTLAGALSASLIAHQVDAAPGITPTEVATLTPNQEKAVIVHDINVLQHTPGVDLTFGRVIGQILTTKGLADTPAARVATVKTMLDSFRATSAVNHGVTFQIEPRPNEAALNAVALLNPNNATDGMRLVAVTNRLDLAPADASTCGEYRMVFAKGDGSDGFNRMTIIFEAAVPNPHPTLGIKGCLNMAKAWNSQQTKSGVALARSVETIFFKGVPGFRPAVDFEHYGNPDGQVRANMFVNTGIWQLREFNVRTAVNKVKFAIHPVNDSPPAILYGNPIIGNPAMENLRQRFWTAFTGESIPTLLGLDKAAKNNGNHLASDKLIYKLATKLGPEFDGFTSTSSDFSEDPRSAASPNLIARITRKIASLLLPWTVNADQVLARTGVTSCAGCHIQEDSASIGPSSRPSLVPEITLPFSLGFVHVDESGNISDRLSHIDLPNRFQAQARFIATQTAAVAPADAMTVYSNQDDLVSIQALSAQEPSDAVEEKIQDIQAKRRAMPGAFFQIRPSN